LNHQIIIAAALIIPLVRQTGTRGSNGSKNLSELILIGGV
jgi:hypothetical protein